MMFVIFKKMMTVMPVGCRYLGLQVMFKLIGIAMLALIGWKVGRTREYSLEKRPEGALWCSSPCQHVHSVGDTCLQESIQQTRPLTPFITRHLHSWLSWKGVSVMHGWMLSSALHWLAAISYRWTCLNLESLCQCSIFSLYELLVKDQQCSRVVILILTDI